MCVLKDIIVLLPLTSQLLAILVLANTKMKTVSRPASLAQQATIVLRLQSLDVSHKMKQLATTVLEATDSQAELCVQLALTIIRMLQALSTIVGVVHQVFSALSTQYLYQVRFNCLP